MFCAAHGFAPDTVAIEVVRTSGDTIQDRPLTEIGGKGLFIKELEQALLAGAIDLAASVTGRPGVDGGKLRLARVLEPFTAVLISINRKYKIHSGIRVTGLDH